MVFIQLKQRSSLLMLLCDLSALSEGKVPVRIPLPGPDYDAGPNLYPSRVIAGGYHVDYDKYTADSWAEYILNESKKYPSCVVVTSYSAISGGGSPHVRCWYGYFYHGPIAVPGDFVQVEGTEDARAYNLVNQEKNN